MNRYKSNTFVSHLVAITVFAMPFINFRCDRNASIENYKTGLDIIFSVEESRFYKFSDDSTNNEVDHDSSYHMTLSSDQNIQKDWLNESWSATDENIDTFVLGDPIWQAYSNDSISKMVYDTFDQEEDTLSSQVIATARFLYGDSVDVYLQSDSLALTEFLSRKVQKSIKSSSLRICFLLFLVSFLFSSYGRYRSQSKFINISTIPSFVGLFFLVIFYFRDFKHYKLVFDSVISTHSAELGSGFFVACVSALIGTMLGLPYFRSHDFHN